MKKHLVSSLPFLLGALLPLGFAPFSYTLVLWLALLLFYIYLEKNPRSDFKSGYIFGMGLNLVGTSWIYHSIHEYGHLHPLFSAIITFLFILYVALFYGLFSFTYQRLKSGVAEGIRPLLFASCWCLAEYFRAHCFGGFPWLILGFSSLTTPFAPLLPWLGIYGPGFVICTAMGYLAIAIMHQGLKRLYGTIGIMLFMLPALLPLPFEEETPKPLSVSIIQGNIKSPDKWDEQLFWQELNRYMKAILHNLAPHQLIILPEAAITVPQSYVHDDLHRLDAIARKKQSAILLGIPKSSDQENNYYNTMLALGLAKGQYFKQQLVPFGEYIPQFFLPIIERLGFPIVNMIPGDEHQAPIEVMGQKIASLICYELAYPEHLRHQLPQGEWIVSISDDGWFGHSLALYQHLQMAQVFSFMAHRDQVFVNNNGLSSIINANGEIVMKLPTWKRQELHGQINAHQQITAWMKWGDQPILLSSLFICLLVIFEKIGIYLAKTIAAQLKRLYP